MVLYHSSENASDISNLISKLEYVQNVLSIFIYDLKFQKLYFLQVAPTWYVW